MIICEFLYFIRIYGDLWIIIRLQAYLRVFVHSLENNTELFIKDTGHLFRQHIA